MRVQEALRKVLPADLKLENIPTTGPAPVLLRQEHWEKVRAPPTPLHCALLRIAMACCVGLGSSGSPPSLEPLLPEPAQC